MPTLEELFDGVGKLKILSTLNLKLRYHQLPLRFEHRVKMTFWGIDDN